METRTINAGGIEFTLSRKSRDIETVSIDGANVGEITRTQDGSGFTWYSHDRNKRLFTSLQTALYDLYLAEEES